MRKKKKSCNKYIWVREGGEYRKLCRNPEYKEEPCSAVDVMKYEYLKKIGELRNNNRCNRVKKWPEVTRESYAEAKDYEKRTIEGIMEEDKEAKIWLRRMMPEMLVVGKTVRLVRIKKNEVTNEIDDILKSIMKGENYVE